VRALARARRALEVLLLAAAVLWAPLALAHKPSDSYLSLTLAPPGPAASGVALTGRWDIALRDLDFAIGLDADGDGQITWGEVRARHADIAAYAQARLSLRADSVLCALTIGPQMVDDHTDGAYTVLPLQFVCGNGAAPATLEVDYRLFADIDPQHRGLLNLSAAGLTRTAVLGPQAAQQSFALAETSAWRQFGSYADEGLWHIWIGFDHILFLLSLLLPAVLVLQRPRRLRGDSRAHWAPVARFGEAFWDVLRIVTAFTVAHSITLSLATLGYVSLPSRLVESAIAASVVLAALNNVWPVFQARRWTVAFAFGLIHGFGFASVLADLGLPQDALVLALLGFNLGVEGGQLAIVAAFLPLAFALRRTLFYRRVVLWSGSLLIALLAGVWLAERALNLKLL
jgi:hypothetical protein